jgi:hypothetical protein
LAPLWISPGQIYPGVQLRSGIYPEKSIVKLKQELGVVPQT